jgi:anti-anti-sigma regulatory factor
MIIEARGDVVHLQGTLDKNLWPTIQAAANLLLRQNVQGIIIDGEGLNDCSPEGAKTFRDAMDYIEHYHARIVVCQMPPCVMDVIRAVPGVRSRLPIAETVEAARASLKLGGPGAAAKGPRTLQMVLVPLLRPERPELAAGLACRLARSGSAAARIHLTYILEVPRQLPLTAPLPEEEAAAVEALAAAEKEVRRQGLSASTHVSRTRDAGEDIIHLATSQEASIVLMTYQPPDDPSDNLGERVVKTVFGRAPCEIVLNKVPA